MDLEEFNMEFIIGFNGKVSVEEDIEVVVEDEVGDIERTIDFTKDSGLEGFESFYI